MTDPRFYMWLWQIENEIRSLVPTVYYHVWDNYPYPKFNKILYDSTDVVVTISKVTSDIVRTVSPQTEEIYLPHAVDSNIFKKYPPEIVNQFKIDNFKDIKAENVFFWNNRNARRKQSGTLLWWFKEYLDKVGYEKACLIMHTDPKDENGQDLTHMIKDLGLDSKKSVLISKNKLPPDHLAMLYNCVDCTINISDAEGFGLATFESLACETPIIAIMTGGLQEQLSSNIKVSEKMVSERELDLNKVEIFDNGIGIKPASSAIIGSQQVPYIREDRISKNDFMTAIEMFCNMSKEKRKELGQNGRKHIIENYNYDNFISKWDQIMHDVRERHGSWETRKIYKPYELRTL